MYEKMKEDYKIAFIRGATTATGNSFKEIEVAVVELIDELICWIESKNIPKDKIEFQTLYGVPMNGRLESLIESGYNVRIYVPFGPDWFDYSIRRLKENPDIAKYVLKNFLKND